VSGDLLADQLEDRARDGARADVLRISPGWFEPLMDWAQS